MKDKRVWSMLLCFVAGCSTHPLVDTLDFFKPGHLAKTTVNPPYGGVAIPQGPIVPVSSLPTVGLPVAIPGVGVVPPPMPLPGNTPPGVQLQTPTPGGTFLPLPPDPPHK